MLKALLTCNYYKIKKT